jgi:hypothetical protein
VSSNYTLDVRQAYDRAVLMSLLQRLERDESLQLLDIIHSVGHLSKLILQPGLGVRLDVRRGAGACPWFANLISHCVLVCSAMARRIE